MKWLVILGAFGCLMGCQMVPSERLSESTSQEQVQETARPEESMTSEVVQEAATEEVAQEVVVEEESPGPEETVDEEPTPEPIVDMIEEPMPEAVMDASEEPMLEPIPEEGVAEVAVDGGEGSTEPLPEGMPEPPQEGSLEPLPETTVDLPPEATFELPSEGGAEPPSEGSIEPPSEGSIEPLPEGEAVQEAGMEPTPEVVMENMPSAIWQRGFSSSSTLFAKSIAKTGTSDFCVAGYFRNQVTLSGTTLQSAGGIDIFVAKVNRTGGILWFRRAGGQGNDTAFGVAGDSQGSCYVTGFFQGTASFGTIMRTFQGTATGFFATRLDGQGNFVWATHVGAGDMPGYSIQVNAQQEVYVTGTLKGSVTIGNAMYSSVQGTSSASVDAYVLKLNAMGQPVWFLLAGSPSTETTIGHTLGIRPSGMRHDVCITGSFRGSAVFGMTTLTPTPSTSGSASTDMFVACAEDRGATAAFRWAKGFGGTGTDKGTALTLGTAGGKLRVYVAGEFRETWSAGMVNLQSAGGTDVFALVLDEQGQPLQGVQLGGSKTDNAKSIALTGQGDVLLGGTFQDTVSFAMRPVTSGGRKDGFLVRWSLPMNRLSAPVILTGTADAIFEDLVWDTAGYVVTFGTLDAAASVGTLMFSTSGPQDGFVARLAAP